MDNMNVHKNISEDKRFIENIERINKEFILTYLDLYKSQHNTLPNDIFIKISMVVNEASRKAFEEHLKQTSEQEEIPIFFGIDSQEQPDLYEDTNVSSSNNDTNEDYVEQQNNETVSDSNIEEDQVEQENNDSVSSSNNINENQQNDDTVSGSNNNIDEDQAEEQNDKNESCSNLDPKVEEQNGQETEGTQKSANEKDSNTQLEASDESWSEKAKSNSAVDFKYSPKAKHVKKNTYSDYKGRDKYENSTNSYKEEKTKYDCLVCDCEVYLNNKNHGTPACRPCLKKLYDYGWENGICFFHFSSCHECSFGEKCNKWHGQKDKDGPIPYWNYETPDIRK